MDATTPRQPFFLVALSNLTSTLTFANSMTPFAVLFCGRADTSTVYFIGIYITNGLILTD